MSRLTMRVRTAVAGVAVVMVVGVATPAALTALAMLVRPSAWTWQDVGLARGSVLLALVVAVVAWVIFAVDLGLDVVNQLRSNLRGAPEGSGARVRMVGWVVGLVIMVFPASLAIGSSVGASVSSAQITLSSGSPTISEGSSPDLELSPHGPTPSVFPVALSSAGVVLDTSTSFGTYVVVSGDCLSTIAQRFYGDESAWRDIWAANTGRTMPGGAHFLDPNLIYPGWTLSLPGMPTTIATPVSSDGLNPVPPGASLPKRSGSKVQSTETQTKPVPMQPANGATANTKYVVPSESTVAHKSDEHHGPSHLPELIVLGVGAIGCAALTRRVRRLRLLRHLDLAPGGIAAPSEDTVDTEVLMARFARVPALEAFEMANNLLGSALLHDNPDHRTIRFRAVCVGPAGVDFWLTEPGQPAPEGFSLTSNGTAWRAHVEFLHSTQLRDPYCPIVIPIGEDEVGTWLVPLAPGVCVPLVGEAANELWRAASSVQEAWAWADGVIVTSDPCLVAAELLLHGGGGPDVGGRHVLYSGDPTLLPDDSALLVSIVTTSPALASDVSVLVDHRAASIHPLGRTVRPHLLDMATSIAVCELTDAGEPKAEGMSTVTTQLAEPPGTNPGVVEVRLLTVNPRIDGLSEQLPPNRSRRAVELVAYLALHQLEGVTSDRLRTRVLGTSDADAASKTLFNTATAARRALGNDTTGQPLLPPGSRTGHYCVSSEVTVDVLRAASLAAMGSATEDSNIAIAQLRAALDLVEGEPLANTLSGYTWWEAEGHAARVAAVLVSAASDLAALAVVAGDFELAQWGLEKARFVDPYSEALSRVAMQVATAAGDADRLRREWRDCVRRVDELDPGATPSARTERLYGELAQMVLVGATQGNEP